MRTGWRGAASQEAWDGDDRVREDVEIDGECRLELWHVCNICHICHICNVCFICYAWFVARDGQLSHHPLRLLIGTLLLSICTHPRPLVLLASSALIGAKSNIHQSSVDDIWSITIPSSASCKLLDVI